jgi:topoisomerase (DNA) II binding protein 1
MHLYLVAVNLSKCIMAPEWVDAVYVASKTSFTHGSDAIFNEYKCPLFRGYVITVSGLSSNDRMKIKETVEREGGRYTGEMKINDCTHLIIKEPKGTKYQFAKKWSLHIVRPDWLTTCIEAGYAVEESKFQVDGVPHSVSSSTPSSDASRLSNISDISGISMSHINETANTTMQSTFHLDPSLYPLYILIKNLPFHGYMFLDGCKVTNRINLFMKSHCIVLIFRSF